MNQRHDLSELITKLSKTEKRYIKLQISVHGTEKVYSKLLDLIDKKPDVSDVTLENILFKNNKDAKKSISVYKNYLYHVILKALRNYYQKSSENQENLTTLANLEILLQKGLYTQCLKIIRKRKKRCYHMEKYHALLELIRFEKQIIMVNSYSHISYAQLNSLYKEEQEIIAIIKRISVWWRSANIINKNILSNENKRIYPESYYRKVLDSKYMHTSDSLLQKTELYYKNIIFSGCYFALNDIWNHYLFTKKNMAFVEANPDLRNEEINRYLSLNFYLMKVQLELDLMNDTLENITKLENLVLEPTFSKSENVICRVFTLRMLFGMRAHIKIKDFVAAEKMSVEFNKTYEQYANKIDPVLIITIEYYQALLSFYQGKSKQSLTIIQKILNDKIYDIDKDVFRFARILQAAIHYQSDSFDVLEYLVKSLQNQYKHVQRYYRTEKLILAALSNALYKKPKKEKLEELRQELITLKKDPFEKEAFEFFDPLEWLKL